MNLKEPAGRTTAVLDLVDLARTALDRYYYVQYCTLSSKLHLDRTVSRYYSIVRYRNVWVLDV